MTPLQKEEDLRMLFDQWVKGPLDKSLVLRLVNYADDEHLADLWRELIDNQKADDNLDEYQVHAEVIQRVYKNLLNVTPELRVKKAWIRMLSTKWYAAAAVLFAITLSVVLYTNKSNKGQKTGSVTKAVKHDLSPGRNGAILTLSDGTKVLLDSVENGVVATEKGAAVSLKGNQLVYQADKIKREQAIYNTMTTPRGRKFQLTLADGTRVWLNTASSITYPTKFVGKERKVAIQGEVYFEVAANKNRPFIVSYPISHGSIKEGQVEVLGTSFSINAYSDESFVKTTLIKGSVRVRRDQSSQILAPGQQAHVDAGFTIRLIPEADIAMETAWINGEFNFKYADLKSVMRQLSRWYDLEVIYEDGTPVNKRFGGEIPMDAMLSQVLGVLEKSGVRFNLDGRKLTILP